MVAVALFFLPGLSYPPHSVYAIHDERIGDQRICVAYPAITSRGKSAITRFRRAGFRKHFVHIFSMVSLGFMVTLYYWLCFCVSGADNSKGFKTSGQTTQKKKVQELFCKMSRLLTSKRAVAVVLALALFASMPLAASARSVSRFSSGSSSTTTNKHPICNEIGT